MPIPAISIFDIPLIVAEICLYLDSNDIRNSYRVSKSWHQLFGPYRYRDVIFANLKSIQTWNILNHAHRIRKLEVDLADAKYLINSSCTRLTELSCVDFEYTTWRPSRSEDNAVGYWNWSYDHFWQSVDSSVNALSLIAKNPNLRGLTVKHLRSRIYLQPFTKEIVSALSVHSSLTSMSINLRLEVKTLVSVLVNCPPKLQELEIWLSIFEDAEDKIEQMRMTRPTALRSLIFHDSLCGHEKAVLVPLLKQCPVLKNVKLPQINQAAYQEVLSSMIESCPILHSFENNNRHGFDIGRGLQLVEGFNGLRQVILNCTGILGGIPPVTPGATIKALLASSTGTLEVLKMYDRFSRWNPDITVNWIMGVVDVLEHCPNLKELEVPHGCVSLDDLVHKKDWDRPLWTDISTTNKEKMLLPWACKKLETLSLNIDNPSIKCFDPTTGSSLFDQQTSETEELGYKTVMQLGLLCQTLRSLKSLKSLDLAWDPFVLGAIGSMPFDRASFYYESYKGLQGITQQDIRWLGIEWCTIAERAQQEQLDRMCRVARKRSSHVCNTMEANSTTDPEDDEEEGHVELDADIDEMDMDIDLATHHDWIWYLNRKKVNKSKGVYARRSLRNGMSWFGKGAIDSSRY